MKATWALPWITLPMLMSAVTQGAAPSGPVAVNKPTVTYLPEKKWTVLFGGFPSRGPAVAETWALENGCWRKLEIAGPPARGAHGAAYDARRRRLVVFGGDSNTDGKALGDTWEFDGEKWERKALAGPNPRVTLRMAFDDKRNRVILFGGSDGLPRGTVHGDTWEWDGLAWAKISESGPPSRFEGALAYDARRRTIVSFGGNGSRVGPGHKLGDTWLREGNIWKESAAPGPGKRDHHAMAYHAARGVVLLFGGHGEGGFVGDTWTWDGEKWTELKDPRGPSARGGVPAMTYDSDRKKIVLYGGWGDDGPLRDLWEWDGRWTEVPVSVCGADAKPGSP